MSDKEKTLYVRRPLINTREILAWAILQGFDETMKADDLHVTIAYSKKPVDWSLFKPREMNTSVSGGVRFVEPLGDQGAVCLIFQSDELAERHRTFDDGGASWDWPQYRPHVTITYRGGAVDLSQVMPFAGTLEFGPEVFEEVDENWAGNVKGAEDEMAMDWSGTVRLLTKQDAGIAFDKASVRRYDLDKRLHVGNANISKANICEYFGREIPGAERFGLVPDRKYRLLRHPDELRKGASTFNNLPILRLHVPVSAEDHKPEDVIGSTGTDAEFDDPYLTNSLVFWSQSDIDDIENDVKKELSSAYRYTADMTSGTYENEPYDGVMREIIGNHVALVKEGRAGPDVVVGDEKPSASPTNATETIEMAKTVNPRKAALAKGIKLAADAKLDDLKATLMAIDESEPDEVEKKKAEDGTDIPEAGGGKGKGPAGDRKGKDKAMDRKARDEAKEGLKEKLKEKLSAEDWKAACDDIDGMEAEDESEEGEEEKKAREAKEAKDKKAKDEESVTKKDVDKAMDEAIAGERQRQREVREAERNVRPWVGDLAIAYDSADEVYRSALEARGVSKQKLATIHPSAYRAILEMTPKPGSEVRQPSTRVAMDSAGKKSFEDMYPGAAKIRITA